MAQVGHGVRREGEQRLLPARHLERKSSAAAETIREHTLLVRHRQLKGVRS
jgi:hypothetical protein